jgi:hypothetical protein
MRSIAAFGVVWLFATSAAAEIVIIDYQGVVDASVPEFASIASAGDPVSGRITYDTAAPDTDPDPSSGVYLGVTHEFHFGSFSGTSTGGFLRIFDDGSLPPFDGFQVIDFDASDEVGTIGGAPVTRVVFAMNASTDLYASDALPTAPPLFTDPRLFERYASIDVVPPGMGSTSLVASLTSVTVPEPAGAMQLGAATLVVLGQRSRRGAAKATIDTLRSSG